MSFNSSFILYYINKKFAVMALIIKNFLFFMEQDTGLEPAPSAWKADMLATDTNPA